MILHILLRTGFFPPKSGIGANATATPTSTMVSPQFSIFFPNLTCHNLWSTSPSTHQPSDLLRLPKRLEAQQERQQVPTQAFEASQQLGSSIDTSVKSGQHNTSGMPVLKYMLNATCLYTFLSFWRFYVCTYHINPIHHQSTKLMY